MLWRKSGNRDPVEIIVSSRASWKSGRGNGDAAGITPEPFEIIVVAGLLGEDVDDKVAIIHQHPFGILMTFDVRRTFAGIGEALADLVADGLDLARIAAGADDEVVGKRGNLAQVENGDVGGFFGFGGADRGEPGCGGFRFLGQQLLSSSSMIQRPWYTGMKMRLLGAAILCSLALTAQTVTAPAGDSVSRAQQEIEKMRDLVAAGALAPARLAEAEQALGDAHDEAILNRTLYGSVTVQDLTEEQSSEMITAARRRLEREREKLARQQKLVDAGVLARGELAPIEQEIESRRLAVDLAESRARLLDEIAEIVRREEAAEAAAIVPQELPSMERFGGDGTLTAQELKAVELAYVAAFKKPLPISANGATALHRSLGFDHRGRVDVALNPDQREGIWLRAYLEKNDIPYYAFRNAIAGKATGAHIHIGPGSTRIRVAD